MRGDDEWKGWWGDDPPYHCPVIVLTHHTRSPIEMEGGTTFFFVNEAIEAAVERALDAADGKDVRVGGDVATVRAGMRARLLGSGERLFVSGVADDYERVEFVSSPAVAHVRLARVQ